MTSIAELVRRDARRTILQALADDLGYSLNHEILRTVVDRRTAVTLTTAEVKEHLAWLEDQGAITTTTVAPFVIARLTDYGLALAHGAEVLEGVSRPRPDQV